MKFVYSVGQLHAKGTEMELTFCVTQCMLSPPLYICLYSKLLIVFGTDARGQHGARMGMTAAYASHLLELHYRSQFSMKPPSVVIVTAGHEGEVANLNPLQHKRIRPLHGSEAFLRNNESQSKKFSAFCGTQKLIIVFIRVRHWTQSRASNIISVVSIVILSLHPCPSVPIWPLPVRSSNKNCLSHIPVILHTQSISPTLFATVLVHWFLWLPILGLLSNVIWNAEVVQSGSWIMSLGLADIAGTLSHRKPASARNSLLFPWNWIYPIL